MFLYSMADEGIITYDKLYDILRLEKYKKELQKLDSDFYIKVMRYLDDKRNIVQNLESKESVFASQSISKTKKQLDNIKMILREIYEKREGKIIQMALFSSRTGERLHEAEAMLEEEHKFFNDLINIFDKYRGISQNEVIIGRLNQVKHKEEIEIKIEEKKVLVRFLHSIPEFLGYDMKTYGPFEANQEANLPFKVSEVLIKNRTAEEVL